MTDDDGVDHRVALIVSNGTGEGGTPEFVAACSCGWQSETFSSAALAGAAFGAHCEVAQSLDRESRPAP